MMDALWGAFASWCRELQCCKNPSLVTVLSKLYPRQYAGLRTRVFMLTAEVTLTRTLWSSSMSEADRFIAWCKQEQASIQQQLELMEAAKVLTGENLGSGWVETTAESMESALRQDSRS